MAPGANGSTPLPCPAQRSRPPIQHPARRGSLDGTVPRLTRGGALHPELVLAVRAVDLVDDPAGRDVPGGFAGRPPATVEAGDRVFGRWEGVGIGHGSPCSAR